MDGGKRRRKTAHKRRGHKTAPKRSGHKNGHKTRKMRRHTLFSVPEKNHIQPIVVNPTNKQFGNMIIGLRKSI
jgi:hypothetical protein